MSAATLAFSRSVSPSDDAPGCDETTPIVTSTEKIPSPSNSNGSVRACRSCMAAPVADVSRRVRQQNGEAVTGNTPDRSRTPRHNAISASR